MSDNQFCCSPTPKSETNKNDELCFFIFCYENRFSDSIQDRILIDDLMINCTKTINIDSSRWMCKLEQMINLAYKVTLYHKWKLTTFPRRLTRQYSIYSYAHTSLFSHMAFTIQFHLGVRTSNGIRNNASSVQTFVSHCHLFNIPNCIVPLDLLFLRH